jgi:hypothetical protein
MKRKTALIIATAALAVAVASLLLGWYIPAAVSALAAAVLVIGWGRR